MFWFTATCVLAEACSHLGDALRAQQLHAQLLPYRNRMVQVTQAACFGSAERFLGLLADDPAQADAHFETAIARNADIPSMLRMTRAHYADVLEARGEPERAAAIRGDSGIAATQLGLP
jgi:hypothetical protein